MSVLAIHGGNPVRDTKTKPWPKWPVWDQQEEKALLSVLHSGLWSYNGPKELEFNRAFAEYIGSKYSLLAANGTITLQLALESCGIGLGDEVIVPGLTWQATAASVVDVNAVPILVDVTEDTWCIDPAEIEKAISPRTKAIIPVHLYDCMADMDSILQIAQKYNLKVIEDCAHKHGGEYKGKRAGNIGDIGSFSFQLSKLMTSGEGGALTVSKPDLYEKLDALRNCGRRPEQFQTDERGEGHYGDEGNFIQSGNYRITDFQAALLLESLKRLPEQNDHRERNVRYLNSLLSEIPGITPMRHDASEKLGACFNFSFRYDKNAFNELPVQKFREAMTKELGFTFDSCYEPLNECPLYAPHTKPWRYKLTDKQWEEINPKRFSLPVCQRLNKEEAVCCHFALLLTDKPEMNQVAEAIQKISANVDELL